MARVQTLLQLELKNAMQRFKADLRFDAQRIGSWFVAFEDGSAYTPTPEILKPLRRLFDRRVMA